MTQKSRAVDNRAVDNPDDETGAPCNHHQVDDAAPRVSGMIRRTDSRAGNLPAAPHVVSSDGPQFVAP